MRFAFRGGLVFLLSVLILQGPSPNVRTVVVGSANASEVPLPFVIGGPFELVDHSGRTVTDRDFGTKFLLVYFGYTYCPDICPTDLAALAAALDRLDSAELDRLQPLFITVDPGRDTPRVLADYVSAFHPAIVGLTGSEDQIAAAAQSYRVHRMRMSIPDMEPDEYLMNHTPNAYLIGPSGQFVTLFPHDSSPAFITKVLRKYLAAVSTARGSAS